MLLADEVYQTNIYAEGRSFLSFKKVRPVGPSRPMRQGCQG